jgi:hypothetical protein
MKIIDIIIVFLLVILFFLIFIRKNNKTVYSQKHYDFNKKHNNLQNIIEENENTLNVSTYMDNIHDKPIQSPANIKQFNVIDDISNINNNYNVQPGLYDKQLLPKKVIDNPIKEKIDKTLDRETKIEQFNNDDKTISQLYDELIDTDKFKITTKESLNTTHRVIPAYKGATLEINNWSLYKNDNFVNGGMYDDLIGLNQLNKSNIFRIADDYNDFEIKEFI